MSVGELSDGSRAGEWVPHVHAARDEREQNLEACLIEGQLHYRALRTLPAGAELKVWYHRDLANALAIPELQPAHIKGNYSHRMNETIRSVFCLCLATGLTSNR